MKRLLTLLVLLATLSFTKSHAQFDAGTGYLAAGLSNFNLNYTDKGGIRAGINIDGGYFLADCLMARASFGYNHYSKHDDAVTLGAGLRYYIIQNGLSIGTVRILAPCAQHQQPSHPPRTGLHLLSQPLCGHRTPGVLQSLGQRFHRRE